MKKLISAMWRRPVTFMRLYLSAAAMFFSFAIFLMMFGWFISGKFENSQTAFERAYDAKRTYYEKLAARDIRCEPTIVYCMKMANGYVECPQSKLVQP